MGLPGSGKSTLAEPFAKLINGVWLNSDKIRQEYNDWDFSPEGCIKQAMRMRYLADGVVKAGKIAVADFVCSTEKARQDFSADFVVWMDTVEKNEDSGNMFDPPLKYNYHVSKWFTDTHLQLSEIVNAYIKNENDV